jgi:hypothetical protein
MMTITMPIAVGEDLEHHDKQQERDDHAVLADVAAHGPADLAHERGRRSWRLRGRLGCGLGGHGQSAFRWVM